MPKRIACLTGIAALAIVGCKKGSSGTDGGQDRCAAYFTTGAKLARTCNAVAPREELIAACRMLLSDCDAQDLAMIEKINSCYAQAADCWGGWYSLGMGNSGSYASVITGSSNWSCDIGVLMVEGQAGPEYGTWNLDAGFDAGFDAGLDAGGLLMTPACSAAVETMRQAYRMTY